MQQAHHANKNAQTTKVSANPSRLGQNQPNFNLVNNYGVGSSAQGLNQNVGPNTVQANG